MIPNSDLNLTEINERRLVALNIFLEDNIKNGQEILDKLKDNITKAKSIMKECNANIRKSESKIYEIAEKVLKTSY